MGILPLILLAFLFVTVGFIGGVLITLWWVEREKTRIETQVTDLQPPINNEVQQDGSGKQENIATVDSQKANTLLPETLLNQKPTVIENSLFHIKKNEPKEPISEKPIKEPGVQINLVAQIDTILQDLILHSSLAKRDVHLVEDSTNGVVVWIGLDKYKGIDSVPDDEIRTLIHKAVNDWEQRMGSKRS
jgi:hypothetical protein